MESGEQPMERDASQEKAISYMDGPLRVIAGPGSGKTRVVVHKVANLVKSGIPEESIMCVTFTEKAAGEMRKRLYNMGIKNVHASTIHSLCLKMLKENPITTGITENTAVFSEMAKLVWCVRNLDDFGIDEAVINLGSNPGEKLLKMIEVVRLAKRELISADELAEYLQTHEPEDPAEQAAHARLTELVKLYRHYDNYKTQKDLIDYDDMLALAVRHLKHNDIMRQMYQNRYRYVLVDEFQDNNYAQFLFATLLAESGQITVVGDDDQSIMGFQGAFDGIFDEFNAAYPDVKTIPLNKNRRCSGNISAVSLQLLQAGEDREVKELFTENPDGEPVRVVMAADEASEREFVAKKILELAAGDTPYHEMAILCSTNAACKEFAKTLRSHKIPVAIVEQDRIMLNPTISEVVALLRIAVSPRTAGREVSYVLAARGIHEDIIQAINRRAKGRARSNGLDSCDDCVFAEVSKCSGTSQDAHIQEIVRRFEDMKDEARSSNLLELLYKIMTDYSDAYQKNANDSGYDSARNVRFLNELYDVAKDYLRYYRGERLSDFIDYLDTAGDDIPVDSDTDDSNTDDSAPEDSYVSVLTIHKSKGKEFKTVFVSGVYEGGIPKGYRTEEIEIPRQLLKGKGRMQDPEEVHLRVQRNLLYVAMTRAMNALYVIVPGQAKTSSKARKPSRFLEQIEFETNPRIEVSEYGDAAVAALEDTVMQHPLDAAKSQIQENACKAVLESRPQAAIRSIVQLAKVLHIQDGNNEDSFDLDAVLDVRPDEVLVEDISYKKKPLVDKEMLTLSATAIQTYQKCPLKFRYGKILHIPEKPTINLTKGGVIHSAIEYMECEQLAGRTPDITRAASMAREGMNSGCHITPNREYNKAESSIDKIMENYAKWEGMSTNTLVAAEKDFEIMIAGIIYKGRIDRVEQRPDGRYELVDFKTGKTVITKKAVITDPQTNIYAAAARQLYGSLPARVSLVYLEKDTSRVYEVSEESLEKGLSIIRECTEKILNEEFDPTPSFDCKFCSYKTICPAVTTTD